MYRLGYIASLGGAMARQLTTRAQVNGYRFLLRRLEHALVRRDVRMLHDPMRSYLQALTVGTVLAVLVLAACGVWGLIRPQGSIGDAKILVSRSGGNFVVLGDTLHPVLNLASARLITGSAETPKIVSDGKLAGRPRGPVLGIPGAPSALPSGSDRARSIWTVCDSAGSGGPDAPVTTTVIGEPPVIGDRIGAAGRDDALLVTSAGITYLVYTVERHGTPFAVRAEVDTGSVPVMRALHLEGAEPRPVSAGLLNTFPQVDRITVPHIDGAGGPGALAGGSDAGSLPAGTVVKTVGIDDRTTYHVVLADGIQPIGEAAAEMLRLADRTGNTPVPSVAPGQLAASARSTGLPVDEFPARAPELVDLTSAGTTCHTWSRGADDPSSSSRLLIGRALPVDDAAQPVRLTSADGGGPGVDQVYLRPGTGQYIQVTGAEPDSPRAESRYYISDLGVRFGVADEATGKVLGIGDRPVRAPWSVISLLAPGPSLSRTAALVAHDGVAADPDGRTVPEP